MVQDVGAKAKEFNNLSGKYVMELIIGDAIVENPVMWPVVGEFLFFQVMAGFTVLLLCVMNFIFLFLSCATVSLDSRRIFCFALKADIQLTFHDDAIPSKADPYRYTKRPEIKVSLI